METLSTVLQWLAIVVVGLIARVGLALVFVAAIAVLVLPFVYAIERGRRLVRRMAGEAVHGLEWRRDRRYAPGHLWARERGRAVRIGLDALAARLLAHADDVRVPPAGTCIRMGDPVATFAARARRFVLPAPVDGVVDRVNDRLAEEPALAIEEPYDDGWLVEIDPGDRRYRAWPRAAAARTWFSREAERLTIGLEHAMGLAAADGGVPIVPHHLVLGAAESDRLVTEYLDARVVPVAGEPAIR